MKDFFMAVQEHIQRFFSPVARLDVSRLTLAQKRRRQQQDEQAVKMRVLGGFVVTAAIVLALVSSLGGAWAADPQPRQLGLPAGANELAIGLNAFHDDILLPLCIAISVFVLVLILYVCWRFSEKRNPTPSVTTHHTALEVIWTVVPVLILAALVAPSMRLLYASDKALDYEFAVKITANQWYWNYEYPDHDEFSFDSYMIADEDLQPGQKRLMDVDNPMVIPVGTPILLQYTSNDVLHNWSVSEFGVRVDTVPGQLGEVPLYPINETGTYYGFCSELCGALHSYMPITVKVVTKQEFADWLIEAKEEFASLDPSGADIQLAAR